MMFNNNILNKIFLNKHLNPNKNNMLFVPRQIINIEMQGKYYYVSLVCDNDFNVRVVLIDKDTNNIISVIKEIDGYKAYITKMNNNLYIFSNDFAYICDINNLSLQQKRISLDIQGICSNKKSIYAYSITLDKIIEFDKNLNPINYYDNIYSKENHRISIELTCNDNTFFSIPIMASNEEQYYLVHDFMMRYFGEKIANTNDSIHSCSFDNVENTLYISMYNIIFVIKDGIDFGYIYFKDSAITTAYFDNDINELIINFGNIKHQRMCGYIIKLSKDDIKKKIVSFNDIKSPFRTHKNNFDTILLEEQSRHKQKKLTKSDFFDIL